MSIYDRMNNFIEALGCFINYYFYIGFINIILIILILFIEFINLIITNNIWSSFEKPSGQRQK